MANITISDTDRLPICPHCDTEITTIERIAKGFMNVSVIYLCGKCHKILSIGYNVTI